MGVDCLAAQDTAKVECCHGCPSALFRYIVFARGNGHDLTPTRFPEGRLSTSFTSFPGIESTGISWELARAC